MAMDWQEHAEHLGSKNRFIKTTHIINSKELKAAWDELCDLEADGLRRGSGTVQPSSNPDEPTGSHLRECLAFQLATRATELGRIGLIGWRTVSSD